MLWVMSIREQSQVRSDRQDSLSLVGGATLLTAFVLLAFDARLCALVAAGGVYWLLHVARREQAKG